MAELKLVFDDGEQARVVPRLGDEIARAAAHGFDGDIDGGPGGHDDDGQRGVERAELGEEIEALRAAGGVARIIQIDDGERVVVGLGSLQGGGGRFHGLGDVAFRFQQ